VVECRAREVSERERREQFEELTFVQTRGFELCHAIVGPPRVRHRLPEGVRLVTLCHTEMAIELTALWPAVSSSIELVLGHSPNDTFHVEVVGKLVGEFQKLEEWCSWLERSAVKIYVLLLGPPLGRA
jgi:hypothetical protein